MLSHLEKLSLKPGDVLLVKDHETLHFLSHTPPIVNFPVPLVFSPGGMETLNRQDLLNLLEQLEQTETSQPFSDSPSAPL
jgi:hypothetical protein